MLIKFPGRRRSHPRIVLTGTHPGGVGSSRRRCGDERKQLAGEIVELGASPRPLKLPLMSAAGRPPLFTLAYSPKAPEKWLEGASYRRKYLKLLALSLGDSNPCFRRERALLTSIRVPCASIRIGNTIVSSEAYAYTCRYRSGVVYAHRRDTGGTLEAPTWRAA
jgi:hypothetical protein